MRKFTYYCDRCGKEAPSVVQIGYRTIDPETGDPVDYEFGAELCIDCFDLVDKATMAAVNTKEPPKVKAKKAYSKRDIDMPKVLALRKAGWTIAIMSERSCSWELRVTNSATSLWTSRNSSGCSRNYGR